MGSKERRRNKAVPRITQDSVLSVALRNLVAELAESGTTVILLPVEGDSLARSLFNDEARFQLRQLLDAMIAHPNVHELIIDTSHISDSDYIDTSHLNSTTSQTNASELAEFLADSGLLRQSSDKR